MTITLRASSAVEPEPLARLRLVQWLSPAFPTGAFAYSHGFETLVAEGTVSNGLGARRWLEEVLRFGAGWQDALLLAQTLRKPHEADAIDAIAIALQASSERVRETREQGAAFARTTSHLTGRGLPPRALPVAVGEAAAPLGLAVAEVVALYLHAFASNLAMIVTRHVPLGQSEGQAILSEFLPLISDLAERAAGADLDDLASTCFASDIAAMHHETLQTRIFRT